MPLTRHSVRATGPLQMLPLVHRFFNQARWNLDDIGHSVFQLQLPFCPEILTGAVDDSLARKIAVYLERRHASRPLRSTLNNNPSFPSATVGWTSRYTSLLPSLSARSGPSHPRPAIPQTEEIEPGSRPRRETGKEQTGQANGKQYRSRSQLARMIQIVARWLGPRKLRVPRDSEMLPSAVICWPTPS